MKKILLVADGSAGHIFPATSIIETLKDSASLYLFTTSSYFKRLLKDRNITLIGQEFLWKNTFLEMFYRFWEAIWLLLKIKPDRIIGFGGKGSFFLVLLGSLFFIDTGIYEPNAFYGRANRILRLFAKRIYFGFEPPTKGRRLKRVGIPLHTHIQRWSKGVARERLGLDPSRPVVFCFGGSQGSLFVNEAFRRLVEEKIDQFQIIHLTGRRAYLRFLDFYDKIGKKGYFVRDFYNEMGLLYSAADIVISRAGALTLAEISYFRLPAILIPYPGADSHQVRNAEYFKERGAAFMISQDKFSFENFKNLFTQLLYDQSVRQKVINNLGSIQLWVRADEFCKGIFGSDFC
jgi:UDP-N-acetylglucosamine--N-acetylmuramyl-(pentapeptide) pyrophosphoryl-undecaprenol N-acetylglucosamine transferase